MSRRIRSRVLAATMLVAMTLTAMAMTEIEPNDAVPQALGALGSATTVLVDGASSYAGDIDWFSFSVAGDARETVRLVIEADGEWQIVLYTDALAYVGAGVGTLTRDLTPGAYRARVQPSELRTASYVFVVSNALEREPNDGLGLATPLGTLREEALSLFATIAPAGDVDFFSFDLAGGPEPGTSRIVRIETPCPSGDTLLLLYAWDEALGRLVPVARNDDAVPASWSRLYLADPQSGSYTLRVHEYADNEVIGTYRVVVTSLTLTESEPNNALDQATALGSLEPGGRLTRTQFVAEGDVDAFSFDVAVGACIELETSGASRGDSLLKLYDEAGTEITSDDNGGSDAWSRLARSLAPGKYFATVQSADEKNSFDYTLTVATTVCPAPGSESEPNDSTATADPIVAPCDIAAELAPGNADVYRFEIQTPSTVIAETYGETEGDTLMCLLDADGNSLVCDDDGGDRLWSRIEYELAAGAYFLKVEPFGGTSPIPYHLLLRAHR